jgi:cell division protein FtsW
MLILMLMIGLLMIQPDMGSAMTLAGVAMVMLFVGGMRISHVISIMLFSAPFVYYAIRHKEYRWRRITAFLNPWADPSNTGFQIIQSWLAFGTGGFSGQGLGEGKQKLFYLPEAHTDFILSVIGEELGLAATLGVVLGFLAILISGTFIAWHARDTFGMLLAAGLTFLIALQAIINVGVVTSALPNKGLSLPFISYGGSNLVVMFTGIGLLISVARQALGPRSLLGNPFEAPGVQSTLIP